MEFSDSSPSKNSGGVPGGILGFLTRQELQEGILIGILGFLYKTSRGGILSGFLGFFLRQEF